MTTTNLALRLLDLAGMPWRFTTKRDAVRDPALSAPTVFRASWTGRELIVSPNRDGDDLGHELCHWLVAPPHRRRLPEYGLGNAPYGDVRSTRTRLEDRTAYRDEMAVCMLHLVLLRCLRLPWRPTADVYSMGPYAGISTPRSWSAFVCDSGKGYENEIANSAAYVMIERRGLVAEVRGLAQKARARTASFGSSRFAPMLRAGCGRR